MYIYGLVEGDECERSVVRTLFILENKDDVDEFLKKVIKYLKKQEYSNEISGCYYENTEIISYGRDYVEDKDNVLLNSAIRTELHEWSLCSNMSVYRSNRQVDYDIILFDII